MKEHIASSISLTEVEHLLTTSNKRTPCKYKIDKITHSKSQSAAIYDVSKNKPLLYP